MLTVAVLNGDSIIVCIASSILLTPQYSFLLSWSISMMQEDDSSSVKGAMLNIACVCSSSLVVLFRLLIFFLVGWLVGWGINGWLPVAGVLIYRFDASIATQL